MEKLCWVQRNSLQIRATVGCRRKHTRLDSVVFIPTLCLSSQVIVEKAPKARVPDLDKRKYLVPSDLTGNPLSLPWPFLQQQSLPSPSCVNAIVGLRRGRTEESEWDAPESWVIQRWWCNCSFPSPISLSFPHCCRTLFDLEAAERKESLKEKTRCVLYKPLKIQVCYCDTSLHHKENQTNLLGRSHYRDSQLSTLTSSSYGFF